MHYNLSLIATLAKSEGSGKNNVSKQLGQQVERVDIDLEMRDSSYDSNLMHYAQISDKFDGEPC